MADLKPKDKRGLWSKNRRRRRQRARLRRLAFEAQRAKAPAPALGNALASSGWPSGAHDFPEAQCPRTAELEAAKPTPNQKEA